MEVYRERAYLTAFVAKKYKGNAFLSVNPDEKDRDNGWRYILYVNTEEGQLSWHIADSDLDLYTDVPISVSPVRWDGHTTEEKYERLQRINCE